LRYKKILRNIVINLLILSSVANLNVNRVYADTVLEQTITFDESSQQSRSKTINIPKIYKVNSISVNTGSISYSLSGEDLTINVGNGNATRNVYIPNKYAKYVSDYITNVTNEFGSTTNYSDSDGYSGALSKSGNSYVINTSVQPGSSKTATDSRSSSSNNLPSAVSYSDKDGYIGTLYGQGVTTSTVQTGGSYTPANSKTVSQTGGTITLSVYKKWNGSSWADAGSSVTGYTGSTLTYNDGSYSGTLTKIGGVTYTSGPYDYSPPSNPTVGQTYTSHYEAGFYTYSGTVTKPANDTRTYSTIYSQNYSGTVSQLSITVYTWQQNYSGTVYQGGYDNYYAYTATMKYSVDNVPPTLNLSQTPNNWINGNVSITATASDSESGVQKIKTPDGNFIYGSTANYTVSTNGTYNFITYDNVGNSTTKTITVSNIDRDMPTLTLTPSTNEWNNGNVVITTTATDASSGVKRINLPDGTYVNGANATFTATGNGTYSFTVEDNVGNTTTKVITVSNIDKDMPTLTLTPSSSNWISGNISITATATDASSGVKRIKLPDGTYVNNSSATFTATTNGTYNFEVEDNAGNKTTKAITLSTIDKITPDVVIVSDPAQEAWTNGSVTLKITASDGGSGVSNIKLPNNNLVYADLTNYVVNSNGTYTFTVTDKAGNTTTKSFVVNNIDNVAPTKPIISNNQSWTNSPKVTVTITPGSDNQSGVKEVHYKLEGVTTSGWLKYTVPFDITNEGITTIKARTVDNTGNYSEEMTSQVKIDRTAPENNGITIKKK